MPAFPERGRSWRDKGYAPAPECGREGFPAYPPAARHASLAQDGAGIHSVIHIMDGAAALRSSGVHSLLPGMKPREGWKKGRVDIQDAGRKFLQQRKFHQAHESRQAHAVHAVLLQARGNGCLGFLRKSGFKSPQSITSAGMPRNGRVPEYRRPDCQTSPRRFPPERTGLDGIINGLAIGTGTGTEYS